MNHSHSLLVLQMIVDRLKGYKDLHLENITFVCVQHLLFTTVDLIKSLIILGAKPSNIHIMGKIYSTSSNVIKKIRELGVIYYPSSIPLQLGYFDYYFTKDVISMWDKVSSNIVRTKSDTIIIIDDGSKCIANVPPFFNDNYKIFAIEQTSSGVTQIKKINNALPTINVAFSAAKQLLEAPMIARAVVKKLDKLLEGSTNSLKCGVVGLGVIGRAIARKLKSLRHKVMIYDRLDEKYNLIDCGTVTDNLQLIFQKADYIFGCTGEDITMSLDIGILQGVKNLISCSSQDIEFQSLLRIIQQDAQKDAENVLDNIECLLNNTTIKIYRGGYPVNFDSSGECVPPEEIQLTRGLLLGGTIQAILQLTQGSQQKFQQFMLHPKIQKLIVQGLIGNSTPHLNQKLAKKFADEEWIKNNSSGKYVHNSIISHYFEY